MPETLESADTVSAGALSMGLAGIQLARHDACKDLLGVLAGDPETVLARVVPVGCRAEVRKVDAVLHATITITDRAPIASLAGGITLSMHWDTRCDAVVLEGIVVPLESLARTLDAYDRSVNWSATQEMDM